LARLIFCVTNNLIYDQRMARTCSALTEAGHQVLLVGRNYPSWPLPKERVYRQHRLRLLFSKGILFYAEYQVRLLVFLLFKKADVVVSIDLDTIIPVYYAARFKGWKMAFDAHEYFTGQQEITSRPGVFRVWKWIEKKFLPKFRSGYTVSEGISALFKQEYGLGYPVIRNVPHFKAYKPHAFKSNPVVIYRGAVNEARGLKALAEAMKTIPATLLVYGDGNYMAEFQKIIAENNLAGKVVIKGAVLPEELDEATEVADIGLNLVENSGENQYYSLANKFFDMMMHGLPQVTMDYPEYRAVNNRYEVAVLIRDCNPESIASGIRRLMTDKELYDRLAQNCASAAKVYNWEAEKMKLISFYGQFIE